MKYVLAPGYVRSSNDGQLHWIGITALCRLYGVRPHECFIAGRPDIRLTGEEIWLGPRSDGNYQKVTR